MVNSFGFGDWNEICRNVPSMPVCNLFLRQLLNVLPSSQYPTSLALPDANADPQAFAVALSSAGIGVRAACALPRMASAGGYPGSAGNAANIAFCSVAVLVGLYFAVMAGRRQAAVARAEIRIFFILFALQSFFQIFSTGSFLQQGSTALQWLTAIHLGLVLLLFWTLAWSSFLCLQLLEDGTLASWLPWLGVSVLFFVGFVYICLDTAFSITTYFQENLSSLHNAWIFTVLVILCGLFVLISVLVNGWVAAFFLREKKPILLYAASFVCFVLSQGALWAVSQPICISSSSRVDGTFLSTIFTIGAVAFFFYAWQTMTEDSWDEVQTASGGLHSRPGSEFAPYAYSNRGSQGPAASSRYSTYTPGGQAAQSQGAPSAHTRRSGEEGRYTQQTSPLMASYPLMQNAR